MSEPTKFQKIILALKNGIALCGSSEELQKVLESNLEVLKSEKTVPYGCHCDLEPGMKPDGCVLDENLPHHCIYAGGLVDKWECQYWKPILPSSFRPLPAGSVIEYQGLRGTVVDDEGGESLTVISEESGCKETWKWEFEGTSCKIISIAN